MLSPPYTPPVRPKTSSHPIVEIDTWGLMSAKPDYLEFLQEAEAHFLTPLSEHGLSELSRNFKTQFRKGLQERQECMLPSFSKKLPTGYETGHFASLDIGGSSLRVAILILQGRETAHGTNKCEIVTQNSFPIGKEVRELDGIAFFDWIASRIISTLDETRSGRGLLSDDVLPIGLSWSFPIQQTSLSTGRIESMGKGFRASEDIEGQDFAAFLEAACMRAGLSARLLALVNDSTATLISRAYTHPATRFGLILGTGVNIAAYLPIRLVGLRKFGDHPEAWYQGAHNVIVNAELSMFGHDILPLTPWDAQLKKQHPMPDFQPLEQMVSGMYLGEIMRLVLLDAIDNIGVFGGIVPQDLLKPYSLSTKLMSMIERDTSTNLEDSIEFFVKNHPSTYRPKETDMVFFRSISKLISRRSAAVLAAALHAIWELRLEGGGEEVDALSELPVEEHEPDGKQLKLERTTIAYNGSVMENYPGYKDMCQNHIDELVKFNLEGGSGGHAEICRDTAVGIDLVAANEGSLIGAGVALASALADLSIRDRS